MIPQKLQLKNFLSYGPVLQIIDFSAYSLICLSGKNGHGKSALLDAMTWALWGQARKVIGAAKADQGLLRLGQTQMLVVFDFFLGNRLYRIRREYMETYGKPIHTLEFGIINAETDSFIPLTDKTIRTTQDIIEQTLRLDFDSFLNSAFLRQGSSNEFSKKSPKDRKQILATILGLDQYEVIRKLALEKIKDAHAKKTILSTLQEKRKQELASQEELNTELATLTAAMDDLIRKEKLLSVEQIQHTKNKTLYNEQQKQYHNFSFQLEQHNEQAKIHKHQIKELLTQWRIINKKKQSLHDIHHLKQEKNKIIAAITHHQLLFQDNLEQRQLLLNVTQQINTIEQLYKNQQTEKHHTLQLELERLRAEQKNYHLIMSNNAQQIQTYRTDDNNIMTQNSSYQQELSGITQNQEAITHQEAHLEKRKATYHHFVSLGNWINSELSSLSNKKKLVHKDDPSCPLCEQNLSASRRRFLKLNFEKQESFLAHRLQRLKKIIPALKEILITQHAEITHNKECLQRAAELSLKINDSNNARAKLAQQIAELTTISAQAEITHHAHTKMISEKELQITTLLATNVAIPDQEYQSFLIQKNVLEKQLQEHVYRENDYKKDQEKLTLIEAQLINYEAIQKDITQQESRKDEIYKLCSALKKINGECREIEHKRSVLGDLAAQLHLLHTKDNELETERSTLNNNKELLVHTKGSIENQQKHLTKIKDELIKEETIITQLNNIIDDYQSIATATGKDGIQALLIEDAIPEIEQEANYLLARLTNNQAQIFIESLRDLKKGGTKETLDIKISDQAGIRPYELFSGGEAFRIDFALRIAISKLLARRAGTALQTLIIDEGFGSQDEEGLGHIMDALHKIQDDFSKIIIVSHLPSMKDQFPVQFFVEKGIQGSTVSIIEQG